MYQFLTFLTGVILGFMISLNGGLSAAHGVLPSVVIIHLVGSVFALVLCLIRKEKISLALQRPLWIYLGGAVGVLTTIFQNFAFGHISMTSIIALGLFGQAATSLIFDRFGLMGMEKRPFDRSSIIGIIFAAAGIIVMLDNTVTSTVYAVVLAAASGISIVLNRTINARLSEKIGAMPGSFVNHIVGLAVSFVIMLISAKGLPVLQFAGRGLNPLIYFGGFLGVINIFLMNIAVPKLPAFKFTIISFVSQILTGVLLDVFVSQTYSSKSLAGGLIIAAGVLISTIVEQLKQRGEGNKFTAQ